MSAKIVILGQGEFIEIAKFCSRKISFKNPDVTITILETYEVNSNILSRLETNEPDIIITGRFSQSVLEHTTDIPIISLRLTPNDLFLAIKRSLSQNTHIAIAISHTKDLQYDYSVLEELLQIKFSYITYQTYEELEEKVKEFSKTKGTVIGTGYAVNIARSLGLRGTLIYSADGITESIEHALEIIRFKNKEKKHKLQLKSIINSVGDSIIATNENNEILFVNNSAYNLFKPIKSHLDGKHLSYILSDEELTNEDFVENKIMELNHVKVNANKTSIFQQDKKIGYIITLQDITHIQEIEQHYRIENEAKGFTIPKGRFDDIIYTSSIMSKAIKEAKSFSQTTSSILILGETGTGKELIAQSIHNYSSRKSGPFVAINCASLPEPLLESELFGYESGAFTGASKKGKKGLLEIAHNGTIFLDEINSISPHFQVKLLRVLQEKELVRVGGNKVIPINFRLITASNENLIQLINENKFRADLYYRINVLRVKLPPLRCRKEDILPLTKQFILNQDRELFERIEPTIKWLCTNLSSYDFPGNIRELHNIMERFITLYKFESFPSFDRCKQLLFECIDDQIDRAVNNEQKIEINLKESYIDSMYEAERLVIKKYMEKSNDKSILAKRLGISRTTLYRKLKELEID